jgi:hypothetical protein
MKFEKGSGMTQTDSAAAMLTTLRETVREFNRVFEPRP